jgi:hypothetical protein
MRRTPTSSARTTDLPVVPRDWNDEFRHQRLQRRNNISERSSSRAAASALGIAEESYDEVLEAQRQARSEHIELIDSPDEEESPPTVKSSVTQSSSWSSHLPDGKPSVVPPPSRPSPEAVMERVARDILSQPHMAARHLINPRSSPSPRPSSGDLAAGPSPSSSPGAASPHIEAILSSRTEKTRRSTPTNTGTLTSEHGDASYDIIEHDEDSEIESSSSTARRAARNTLSAFLPSQQSRSSNSLFRYVYPTVNAKESEAVRHLREQMAEMRSQIKESLEIQRKAQADNEELRKQLRRQQDKEEHERLMKIDARDLIRSARRASLLVNPARDVPTAYTRVKNEQDSDNHNAPGVKTKKRVKNEDSLTFPSLSPSTSPSLVVQKSFTLGTPANNDNKPSTSSLKIAVKKKDEELDSDEEKYEGHSRQRFGDLPSVDDLDDEIPLSDDEAEARNRDRKPDPAIKMPEDNDETHLDSYPKWTARREQLYPYTSSANMKLYAQRYTLLSAQGRQLEYMRTGVFTNFTSALFGRAARNWWEAAMASYGVPLANASRHSVRAVKPTFIIPEMSYDPDDDYNPDAEYDQNDLTADSLTFAHLPKALRYDPPPHEAAVPHDLTLTQLASRHAKHLKLQRAAKQPAPSGDEEPSSDEDTDKDDDDETCGRRCRRCRITMVYGASWKRYCLPCAEIIAAEKEATLQRSMPALVKDDLTSPSIATSSSVTTATKGYVLNDDTSRITIGPYRPPTPTPSRGVKREPIRVDEQEYNLAQLQKDAGFRRKNGIATDEDANEEDQCCLGDVLSYVIPADERSMMRELQYQEKLTFRERKAAIEQSVSIIGKFSGTSSDAPAYLRHLCEQVIQYQYVAKEVHVIMAKTLAGTAQTWFETNVRQVWMLKHEQKPFQLLLHRFRQMYIGPHYAREVRQRLYSTKLKMPNPSLIDLDLHYNTFNKLANQLKFADQSFNEKDLITEYYTSLPQKVQICIGIDYASLPNYHEIQRRAQQCIAVLNNQTTPRQDGDMPLTIHAMPEKGKPKGRYEAKARTTETANQKEATCYQCGEKGHYTGRCPLVKQKQTTKGAKLWATRNQERGQNYEFDLNWYIQLADKIEKQKLESKRADNSSRHNNRKHKQSSRQAVDLSSSAKADAIDIDTDDDGVELYG